MIVYSRASDPRPRTSWKPSRLTSAPRTAVTRARSTGISRGGADPAAMRSPRKPRTRSTWSCWMSTRNMSGPPALSSSENSSSRFDCSARTPSTKKAPRPTARRMTRVWLPGRCSPSTAWRSANTRVFDSGRMARISPIPAPCSRIAQAGKPAAHDQPDLRGRPPATTPPPRAPGSPPGRPRPGPGRFPAVAA